MPTAHAVSKSLVHRLALHLGLLLRQQLLHARDVLPDQQLLVTRVVAKLVRMLLCQWQVLHLLHGLTLSAVVALDHIVLLSYLVLLSVRF